MNFINKDKGISLYIHIPFCKKKCFYCDFPSYTNSENLMNSYAEALCCEIDKSVKNKKIRTIFIGGGTPTYLSLDAWEKIKNTILNINKDEDIEFTVECNPDSLTMEKLLLFKSMGVNRLSIGLQSFQNKLLKEIGRIHNVNQFEEAYNNARKLGFKNINIDIMFGLPKQSIRDFKETLEAVIKLKPDHISSYGLIIEEGTAFYKDSKDLELPQEDDEREMYHITIELLKKYGYDQYEISNFCLPGFKCIHNLTYWNLDDYIGCGAAAHSFIDGIRYNNSKDINEYIKLININGNAEIEAYKNTDKDFIEEFMFLGLRKIEGISKIEFFQRFGMNINDVYEKTIKKHIQNSLLIDDGSNIKLTSKGIELSNTVMSDFIL